MRIKSTLLALATAALCVAGSAQAQTAPLSMQDKLILWADKRGSDDLKDIYLRCAAFSSRERMDENTAAMCSTVSELVMKRSFAGDFNALIAWWKAQPVPKNDNIATELLDAFRFVTAEPKRSL